MSEPKRFLSFTIFELISVVAVIVVAAVAVLYYVNPERRETQARNAERGIEMQSYMNALRQNKKDNPDGYLLLEKIPTQVTEIGTCPECFNLKNHLVPKYLDALPADPHISADEETGYYIYRDEGGSIYIEAPHAEFGVDLVDRETI